MNTPLAVIFDVDGVLVDSYDAHFQSWKLLANELGREYSREEFVAGFGRTSREVIVDQFTDLDLTENKIRELDDRKEALYRDVIAAEFPEMPGASALIEDLHNAGFRLAVGSSGPPENVKLVTDRIDSNGLIQIAITGTDVTRGKPDPQVFQLAAEGLGCEPANCIVVEDAPAGIQAAHTAGMACIGFTSTGRTAEELHDAELIIDRLDRITSETIHNLTTSPSGQHTKRNPL